MIQEIVFTKTSGAGNDFIIVDNRDDILPADKEQFARRTCSRYFGVGADGLLLLEKSAHSDFTMRYYNSDGSFGGMCGNGGRCIARYAFVNGIAPRLMSFEALDFIYRAEILPGVVSLRMKDPVDFKRNVGIHVGQEAHRGCFINTGSPHFVEFVSNIEIIDVERAGRSIRFDPAFSPDGTNANFVEIVGGNVLRLRTYERGVESETLACGTGSVAAAIVSHLVHGLKFPITIQVRSGESLTVDATSIDGALVSPRLQGSAHILFDGRLRYDYATNEIAGLAD